MDKKLPKSQSCEEAEKEENLQILKSINNYNDFVVKAGAGSGKTYSLVETIANVIKTKKEILKVNNQKILCITYTNAAVDEVKERIGNTSLVRVSTIHDFLWDTIKNYQPELVELHIKKIKNRIEENDNYLLESVYNNLPDLEKEELKDNLTRNEEIYYQIRPLKATPFRNKLPDEFRIQFEPILNNINKFKNIANKILQNNRLNKTLENIDSQDDDYTKVDYDTNINIDRLTRMKISHDTLLEYSKDLVHEYELLRTIIIDRYPYVFVDEFQDTNPMVVDILSHLIEFKNKHKKKFLVGLFGDEIQNIYDTGIGKFLNEKIEILYSIEKKYNYRSSEAVIKLANFARLDDLEQESAYIDNLQGETSFFEIDVPEEELQETVAKIIEIYNRKWNINEENNLGIFLTMNKYLSNINAFEDIYNFFDKSPYYQKNWEQLNQEFLSKEIDKLGISPQRLFKILYFKYLIESKTVGIRELISEKALYKMNYFELEKYYNKIIILDEASSLLEFIKMSMSILHEAEYREEKENWEIIFSKFYDLENGHETTYETIIESIIKPLLTEEVSDDTSDEFKESFYNLLEESSVQFTNWFNFITSGFNKAISYSTIHGTKGTEFDNVIVILEENFGYRNPNYFKSAISNIVNRVVLDPNEEEKQIIATNLLYVASTRAKKNITFLYFGHIPPNEKKVLKEYFDNYYESLDEV